jgi:hypothetical protein
MSGLLSSASPYIATRDYLARTIFALDKKISPADCAGMATLIHPLRRWLFEHKTTMQQFAASIDTVQSAVSEWCSGKKLPSWPPMLAIAKETHGAVTPNDFMTYHNLIQKPARKRRAA